MSKPTPCVAGGVRLSEALESMSLAYNPITKQLQFMTPKSKPSEDLEDDDIDADRLSKKGSFSDEGNFSISTCEKSDTSDSPKSTLLRTGHQRSKDGGSFSSTISSLSEYSLSGSNASKDEDESDLPPTNDTGADDSKQKKKGISSFFSRGVFPWKSSYSTSKETPSVQDHSEYQIQATSWRLFSSKSTGSLTSLHSNGTGVQKTCDGLGATPASSGCNTPMNHKRQGSTTSEKQFEDLIASSIALIQHERPSHLPAKSSEEASRHRIEHARMVEAARRRAQRDVAARKAKLTIERCREDTLARIAKEWTGDIMPNWEQTKSSKHTQELWWNGLPPSVRGKIWQMSIENKLNITVDIYHACVQKAKDRLKEAQSRRRLLKMKAKLVEERSKVSTDAKSDVRSNGIVRNYSEQNFRSNSLEEVSQSYNSRSNPNLADYGDECSMELIEMDIARTFPHLCIFQPGGPYFDLLHELLGAYACLRPDIGYVQGMSFIAAVLILNMEAEQAFTCFANLLEMPVLKAAFSRDGVTMQRYWSAYERLLEHNVPSLQGCLAPELYLVEWIYTAFAKAMSLDAVCRVWDVMMRDGDGFLFRTALGILHLYQDELKHMDFIAASQFLTKLPEDLNPDSLFRSISIVTDSLDGKSIQDMCDATEDAPL